MLSLLWNSYHDTCDPISISDISYISKSDEKSLMLLLYHWSKPQAPSEANQELSWQSIPMGLLPIYHKTRRWLSVHFFHWRRWHVHPSDVIFNSSLKQVKQKSWSVSDDLELRSPHGSLSLSERFLSQPGFVPFDVAICSMPNLIDPSGSHTDFSLDLVTISTHYSSWWIDHGISLEPVGLSLITVASLAFP